MSLGSGRDSLTNHISTDQEACLIINEAAMKEFNKITDIRKNPVYATKTNKGKLGYLQSIGVVKNLNSNHSVIL